MITIVKPIPYLHTTAGIEPFMQTHQLNIELRSKSRKVNYLPTTSKIMLPKSLKHVNFNHSSLPVFLQGTHNLDSY